MRVLRDFRILPVVLFAAVCLLALKLVGIMRGEGYVLTKEPFLGETLAGRIAAAREPGPAHSEPRPRPHLSWAQEMFNYPDVTGSVPDPKPADKPAAKPAAEKAPADKTAAKPATPVKDADGTVVNLDAARPSSPAERAILERLQERRQEIEARARELEIRDGLLKAAEMRLESRLGELKEMEARIGAAAQAKDDSESTRFKSLVAMYENMKAKEAAKIFDRLDLPILVQITGLINPRKMSDILGQMSPESAERLTVELATKAQANDRTPTAADLPKIQGRPGG